MLILDEAAVRNFLDMRSLIPAMERALSALSAGKAVQPMRVMVPVAEHGGFLGSMPAYAGAQLGAKLVTFFPNNQGIPTHHALVLLFQPETGQPLVVMDGRLITEMRTGAVSAAATRSLARPDSSVLAILGSGVQARSHLEALRTVREFRERLTAYKLPKHIEFRSTLPKTNIGKILRRELQAEAPTRTA